MTNPPRNPFLLLRDRRGFQRCIALLAVVAMAAALGVGVWFCVAVREARDAAIACESQSHLNQLQLALHCYHDRYGCFPPAYLVDEDGVPKPVASACSRISRRLLGFTLWGFLPGTTMKSRPDHWKEPTTKSKLSKDRPTDSAVLSSSNSKSTLYTRPDINSLGNRPNLKRLLVLSLP